MLGGPLPTMASLQTGNFACHTRREMSQYWALRTFTKFGIWVALLAIGLPMIALLVTAPNSWTMPQLVGSLALGVVLGFFVKVFSELAQVIVDMLLPIQN
jgi:hypothetical protein